MTRKQKPTNASKKPSPADHRKTAARAAPRKAAAPVARKADKVEPKAKVVERAAPEPRKAGARKVEAGKGAAVPGAIERRPVVMPEERQSQLKLLIARGKEQGYLTYSQVNDHLPSEIVDRRKVGFRVPLDDWFRTELRDEAWDRLTGSGSFVASTLDRGAVAALLSRHDSGRYNEESRIWTLLSLEVWHEVCVAGRWRP